MRPVIFSNFTNTFQKIFSINAKVNHKIKKIEFVLFCLLLFTGSNYYAQGFAPLQLGNVWVYDYGNGILGRAEIVDSSFFIDSIKYFGVAAGYFGNDRAVRLTEEDYLVMKEDSTFPEPLNEWIYYKKNAMLGDTWQVNYGHPVPAIYTITDTFPAFTFDTLVTGKLLNENFGLVEWDYVWTEEFGQLAQLNWLGEVQYYLKGCVINGKVYGDTTFIVVSVDDITSLLSYELFQNYPNPFNSSTIISFTIPGLSNVLLEVYNLLGEKIVTLIDEPLNAGKHSVHFEADDLPSGIYFYVLKEAKHIQTKKMLLIR